MAKVSDGIETLPKISAGRVGCMNVADDRRTDLTYRECELVFMFIHSCL